MKEMDPDLSGEVVDLSNKNKKRFYTQQCNIAMLRMMEFINKTNGITNYHEKSNGFSC